jgi:hypothetical protein
LVRLLRAKVAQLVRALRRATVGSARATLFCPVVVAAVVQELLRPDALLARVATHIWEEERPVLVTAVLSLAEQDATLVAVVAVAARGQRVAMVRRVLSLWRFSYE